MRNISTLPPTCKLMSYKQCHYAISKQTKTYSQNNHLGH